MCGRWFGRCGVLTSLIELVAAALTFLLVDEAGLVVLNVLESGRTGLRSRPERERARAGVDMIEESRAGKDRGEDRRGKDGCEKGMCDARMCTTMRTRAQSNRIEKGRGRRRGREKQVLGRRSWVLSPPQSPPRPPRQQSHLTGPSCSFMLRSCSCRLQYFRVISWTRYLWRRQQPAPSASKNRRSSICSRVA